MLQYTRLVVWMSTPRLGRGYYNMSRGAHQDQAIRNTYFEDSARLGEDQLTADNPSAEPRNQS